MNKNRKTHCKKNRPTRARSAFILMEVLVSVLILAIGVTMLMQAIINSLNANRLTREYTEAMTLAESKMWELETRYAFRENLGVGEDSGDFTPPFHNFSWRTDVDSEDRMVEYRLKVTILWIHGKREQEYIVESIVPMRRNERDLI